MDVQAIHRLAQQAPTIELVGQPPAAPDDAKPTGARVGIFRDAAFQFYYAENLEALVRAGATLVEISPLRDAELPGVDALYIGGGFPETLAPALSANTSFLDSLRRSVENGLPVYAVVPIAPSTYHVHEACQADPRLRSRRVQSVEWLEEQITNRA